MSLKDVARVAPWAPLGDDQKARVEEIKNKTNELISLCPGDDWTEFDNEEKRLWALARTNYEQACMWAVKAATKARSVG